VTIAVVLALIAVVWAGHWWAGAFVGVVAYLVHCWVHPSAACLYCRGNSRRRSDGGKGSVWHMCKLCGGKGSRRRFGAVLLDGVRTRE
jgi:hypothetical protein